MVLLGGALGFFSRRTKGRMSVLLAFVRRRVALCDPLDGIVMGVASGAGFFINETLFQYVPNVMSGAKYPGTEAFNGLVLLLARGLPEMTEHSAWAGLFGYFIGLAVLQPRIGRDPHTDRLAQRRRPARRVGRHWRRDEFRHLRGAVSDRRRPPQLRVARRRHLQGPRNFAGPRVANHGPDAAAPALATAQPAVSGDTEWD